MKVMKDKQMRRGDADTRTVSTARFRDADTRRALRQIPIFRVEEDTPDRFEKLLARLEAIERGERGSRH